MYKYIVVIFLTLAFSQYNYSLEDLNPSSNFYEVNVGPSYFNGSVTLHYFGNFNWGLCTTRFAQLNDLYEDLLLNGYNNIELVGLGKTQHISSLNNWINSNSVSVCTDESPDHTSWVSWGANQRDLFILDKNGNLVLQQNISNGLPNNLSEQIISLIDCDPNLACGAAETCFDDLLYPTTCGPENCDDPIGECDDNDCNPDLICGEMVTCWEDGLLYPTTCGPENCDDSLGTCSDEECTDGQIDNSNPCNPRECFDGQWFEIIIDCAEQMGVPCEGGVYIDPPEDECCSTCVLYGDINQDGILNVIDAVEMVSLVINNNYDSISDINNDNSVNVLDVVLLIDLILN